MPDLRRRLSTPSPFALAAVVTVVFFVMLTVSRGLVDADYFWHVTTGKLLVTEGLPRSDPFSFTWHGQRWVLHEWLGQAAIFTLVDVGGGTLAAIVFGIVIGLAPVVAGWAVIRAGVSAGATIAAMAILVVIFAPFATVRPQAISWLLLALLLAVLLHLRPPRTRWAWLLVPLFVLWANAHGLYAVGLGVLAFYALLTILGMTPTAGARWTIVSVLGACIAASAFTPAALEGLVYPLRYLDAGDWGLANIQEWQSPDFHDPRHWALLALVAVLLVPAARPGWIIGLAGLGVAMALFATRNAPVGALLAMPAASLGLSRMPRNASFRAPPSRGRSLLEIGFVAVLIGAMIVLVPPAVGAGRPLAEVLPVRAFDQLVGAAPNARVLAEYGWGGYAISRLHATGGLVFVDGRNDMYPEELLDEYSRLRAADGEWQASLDRHEVDAIVMPPSAPIVSAAQAAGWCRLYADSLSVVLLRGC